MDSVSFDDEIRRRKIKETVKHQEDQQTKKGKLGSKSVEKRSSDKLSKKLFPPSP